MKLNELRKKRNLSQAKLAKELGLVRSTICQYEKGNRQPDQETLIKIADFFNVSVDYLLGRTDIENPTFTDEERALGVIDNASIVLSDKDRELIHLFAQAEEHLGSNYVESIKKMIQLAIDSKK